MKLGIVIPWFGRDLKGGAEQLAWQVAARLAARGHQVEVLTTCCQSHQDDWATNHLPAGCFPEPEGFVVRRFLVAERDRSSFDRVCGHLLAIEGSALKAGVPPVNEDDARIFTHELIKSPAMMTFLADHRTDYDRFLLLPYLYGPVLEGVELAGDRAILQPCLHNESYAYLPQVTDAFYRARQILFNSEGEEELAWQLFGPGIWSRSVLVGAGVESSTESHVAVPSGNGASSPTAGDRFLLYLGRKNPGKNLPLLLNAFTRFRAVRPNSRLRLVVAGAGPAIAAPPPETTDAGAVSNEHKLDLLRNCIALIQPSQNESFSRVIMEAWLHGKPVAVHARCPATSIPVKASGGGWLADSEEEWARLFVELDRSPDSHLRDLGENGRRYAAVAADWNRVMDRYESALLQPADISRSPRVVASNGSPQAINQFLPNLAYGDAISNEAIWIRDQLRGAGFDSHIYVQFIDPRVADECEVFSPRALHHSHAAIYHHSIGADMTPHLVDFPGPKFLIYHNITPGEFFEDYRPEFARILRRGRADLAPLARHFQNSVGDSAFNAGELASHGFDSPGVLPLAIDPGKWAFPADPVTMEQMQDGRTNILFVGRFAPNKKQDDLLTAFSHYLQHDAGARLILVGKPEQEDPYVTHLLELVSQHDLAGSVLMPGSVSDAEVAAYYRTADLFWSMSEHEGFCVPLIESMWFDIPIFAFKASAVPETLGDAGLMFTSKEDWPELAAFAHLMVTTDPLREKIIAAQRRRRVEFLPEKISPLLFGMVKKLGLPASLGSGEVERS
jgi:glycosyltransferase involved in cell wall biosynthesis